MAELDAGGMPNGMLTGYYDAAGSESDPGVLTVVGVVSTETKWLRFEADWNAALRRFGVPYLHMKKFTPSIGPYEEWKDKPDLRAAFLQMLIGITKRGVLKTFSCSLTVSGYSAANDRYQLDETFGGAYGFATAACIVQVSTWRAAKYSHCRLLHVVEHGDAGQGEFLSSACARWPAVGEVIPKLKEDKETREWFAPFQPADFIAWELRRKNIDNLGAGGRKVRESLKAIVKDIPAQEATLTEGYIMKMCESHPGSLIRGNYGKNTLE
jgi:hypothetical protein